MESPDVSTEDIQKEIIHHAGHSKNGWDRGVALSSAFLAAFAAICSLFAGHHASEALIEQIQCSDKWSYYQAKSIKEAVLESKMDLLDQERIQISSKDKFKLGEYKKQQEVIFEEAKESQKRSKEHLVCHINYSAAVTFFQISIVVGAVSVLCVNRKYWYLSLIFGLVGVLLFIRGFFL